MEVKGWEPMQLRDHQLHHSQNFVIASFRKDLMVK